MTGCWAPSADSACSDDPTPCRRPLPKNHQKCTFFKPQFQHPFFHAKSAKSAKMDSTRDPIWRPKSTKICLKCYSDTSTKKSFENLAKMMQTRKPGTPKTSISLERGCILAVLQHLPNSVRNDSKMDPKMIQNPSKLEPEASQKQCRKLA